MTKRPILIAVIGYLIGIIWGLYLKTSIVLLYAIIILITVIFKIRKKHIIKNQEESKLYSKATNNNKLKNQQKNQAKKLKLFSISRYFRYIKIIFNQKVLFIIIFFSIISNIIVNFKNQKYEEFYKISEEVELIAKVENIKKSTNYDRTYQIKIENINGKNKFQNTNLYLKTNAKIDLEYGETIKVDGEYIKPQSARNYGGFNYKEYLKTLDIYGTVKAKKIEKISNVPKNIVEQVSTICNKKINEVRKTIIEKAKKYLDDDTYSIYLGIILGETNQIPEEIIEQFKNSNMSHILAISGLHIAYIIIGMSFLFSKILSKKKSKILVIIILILYNLIAGFSPSIFRATIMGVMVLLGSLLYRKADTLTSISFSLLIILIYNPFLITNIGLQLSFAGTLGIIFLNKNILAILNKGKKSKSKIKEIIAVSISAQICILPFILYHFNIFGIYFLITNLILNFVIGPTVILGFIFLIFLIFNFKFASIIAILIKIFINIILLISKLSFLPFAKIYLRTPNILEIVVFLLVVTCINFIYTVKTKKHKMAYHLRVEYLLQVIKYKFLEKKKRINRYIKIMKKRKKLKKIFFKYLVIILIISIIFLLVSNFLNSGLKIHFIDVGQGDSCLIETPENKTILIDGGGSEFSDFDVGKSTLLPYILDRGYTKIDYIIVSHFDTDHVRRIINCYGRITSSKCNNI